MPANKFFSSLILSNKYDTHNRNGFLKLLSTINITGGPIIFNPAPSWPLKHLLSTPWHQPAPKTAESIMFLNILSGFHFVEKVISNFIRKFCRKRYKNTKCPAQQNT